MHTKLHRNISVSTETSCTSRIEKKIRIPVPFVPITTIATNVNTHEKNGLALEAPPKLSPSSRDANESFEEHYIVSGVGNNHLLSHKESSPIKSNQKEISTKINEKKSLTRREQSTTLHAKTPSIGKSLAKGTFLRNRSGKRISFDARSKGSRSNQCPVCFKYFTYPSDVDRHCRIHFLEPNFINKLPTSMTQSINSSRLSSNTWHRCVFCPETFSYTSEILHHVLNHVPHTVSCPDCSKVHYYM